MVRRRPGREARRPEATQTGEAAAPKRPGAGTYDARGSRHQVDELAPRPHRSLASTPMEHQDPTGPGPDGLTIREAQRAVDDWISQFEEGYWPPLSNLARLIEEVGELARELNHRYGHKPKKPDEPEQDLALELADILFVILTIANEQGIDLDAALRAVLEKYRVRDSDRWTRR